MLALIFSIERDEIHGNMHKCGKPLQKAYRSDDQTNIQFRVYWIFGLIFWTTAHDRRCKNCRLTRKNKSS